MSRKAQLSLAITVLLVLMLIIAAVTINAVVTSRTMEGVAYTEEAFQTNTDLYALLNYDQCESMNMPLKELIALSIAQGAGLEGSEYENSETYIIRNNEEPFHSVNVRDCIAVELSKIHELNKDDDLTYEFYVDFENKKYFHIGSGTGTDYIDEFDITRGDCPDENVKVSYFIGNIACNSGCVQNSEGKCKCIKVGTKVTERFGEGCWRYGIYICNDKNSEPPDTGDLEPTGPAPCPDEEDNEEAGDMEKLNRTLTELLSVPNLEHKAVVVLKKWQKEE